MAYKPKIFGVDSGNTGVSSETAYAVLCGGTTSTNPIQSIASVGTSGHLLTSNGAGALPTFQAAAGSSSIGYTGYFQTNGAASPADGITYFFAPGANFTSVTAVGQANTRIYLPASGTLVRAYGRVGISGTNGSAQNCTVALRLNNTTDVNVTTTLTLTTDKAFSNAGLSTAVTAGDYLECKFISPTWTTNPTFVSITLTFLIQ